MTAAEASTLVSPSEASLAAAEVLRQRTLEALDLVAFELRVIRLSAHAVIPATRRDIAADFLDMPQHRQLVIRASLAGPRRRALMS